eukprot:gene43120-53520_t
MHARTGEQATLRSIVLKLENERLVTELRAESRRALAAQEAAEQADRDKSRFLAAASHDLRQPLHAMGLFLETLQRSPLNAYQQTVLGHAHAASGAAAEMLTTLLDYSRLEAGVVKVRPAAFSVQSLLTSLEQEFGVQADAAGLIYRTRETSAAAFADRSLVDLVMHNFISNALRYTSRGGVLIACRQRGARLALEVWDTGHGIPEHQWEDIFKEFHQLGNPERDRRKGLGLGLAIVQRLAREMCTNVEVRSRLGKGSVFRLWLDNWQGALEDEAQPVLDPQSLAGLKVLAIDDDEAVRMGMQSLLQSWGCECLTAESGADAMQSLVRDIAREPVFLRRRERLHQVPAGEIRHAEVTDLSRPHELVEHAQGLLDRRQRVETVQLKQIDVVRPQPPQRRLDRRDQMRPRRAHIIGPGAAAKRRLRGDEHLVAPPLDRRAEDLLRAPARVNIRRVKHREPGLETDIHKPRRLGRLGVAPLLKKIPAPAKRPRAQTEH